jgi:hypothetical protein
MAELNALLLAGAMKDDERLSDRRLITVVEHFALEQEALLVLPSEPFEYAAVDNFRVGNKSRLHVRGAWYSVPVRYAGRRLDVRIGAETIEALDGAAVIATHPRSLKGQQNLTLDHYLEILLIEPGALPGATALGQARASGAFTKTHERFWRVGSWWRADRVWVRIVCPPGAYRRHSKERSSDDVVCLSCCG